MTANQVLFDVTGRVATITLNRPEAMNALAGNMRDVLLEGLRGFETDPNVRWKPRHSFDPPRVASRSWMVEYENSS